MFNIDFDTDVRSAFFHGVLKGMSAPLRLGLRISFPPHEIKTVEVPVAPSIRDALAEDWLKIVHDLQRVIDHEPSHMA